MEITTEQRSSAAIIQVQGSIDALTAEALLAAFQQQIAQGIYHLVADLSGVDFSSSAGIRVLLAVLKEVRQHGGDLRLAAVNAPIHKILEMSGVNSIVKRFPTTDEALASFDAGPAQ